MYEVLNSEWKIEQDVNDKGTEYRKIIVGAGYYDKEKPNASFGLYGYISEDNVNLIISLPSLMEELNRLREENKMLRRKIKPPKAIVAI